MRPTEPPGPLLERFRRGDRLALSRLVSLVARGEAIEAILEGVGPANSPARVVSLTGAGGVGKSSLAGKLIEEIRERGQTVAVLACDPESPLTGGALLGDRFRMPARPDDDGVFIRSLAAAGGQGSLARHLGAIIRLVEAFGFGVVLLLQPETGDDLQWEKAGLLEVADVVVIHKADLPGAERVEAQVVAGLGLSHGPAPAVLRVSARSGAGVPELWEAIRSRPLRRGVRRDADELFRLLRERLAARFAASRGEAEGLAARWHSGAVSTDEALAALAGMLVAERLR